MAWSKQPFVGPVCVASLGVLGLASSAAPARAAQFTYTSQTRTILSSAGFSYIGATGADDVHTTSAPDYGPFDAAVSSLHDGDTPNFPDSGAAEQHSQLAPTRIDMSGSVSGTDNITSLGSGNGFGRSTLAAAFTLDASSAYRFDFAVSGTFGYDNHNYYPTYVPFGYSASLIGPAGTVFDTGALTGSGHPAYAGTLFRRNLHAQRPDCRWLDRLRHRRRVGHLRRDAGRARAGVDGRDRRGRPAAGPPASARQLIFSRRGQQSRSDDRP